jgi:hypothetical protein
VLASLGACAEMSDAEDAQESEESVQLEGQTSALWSSASGVWSSLMNYRSSRCMDAKWGATANGTEVWNYGCNGGTAQLWKFFEDETVRVGISDSLGQPAKCLDVMGGSTSAGAGVHLWDCVGVASQRWELTPDLHLKNRSSGLCLKMMDPLDGGALRMQPCAGDPAQVWVRTASPLQKVGTSKCIVSASTESEGSLAVVGPCNSPNVARFSYNADRTLYSQRGFCLDVQWAGVANGTRLHFWNCNGGVAQRWFALDDGRFYNPHSDKCLDVPNNNAADGTPLQIYTCNTSPAQKFVSYPW